MAVFSVLSMAYAFTSIGGFGYGMGYLATTLTGKILLTFAANTLIGALSPKPSSAGSDRGYQTNTGGTAVDHQIIYGKVKVGGAILYDETTGYNNKYLHRIVGVAGHEIESFEDIYLNDEVVTLNEYGYVISPSQYSREARGSTLRSNQTQFMVINVLLFVLIHILVLLTS